MIDERISIAPMMDWTDPHYRALMRGITRKTVLYSEMVVDETILNVNNLDFFIGHHLEEEPSVIQLGGYDSDLLAQAAEKCEMYSNGTYGEINLNCGCPSQRVSKRCFGAKLMLEPERVKQIVYSMKRRVSMPITVKCRIGVDHLDSYEDLVNFIRNANEGGAKKFIIHARKCLLKGLTTKQNRDIPPLNYEVVHKLVQDFPDLTFVLNGGIQSFDQALEHMNPSFINGNPVNGVMIGRSAYSNPLMFATADSTFYQTRDQCLTRRQVIEKYLTYCDWCMSDQGPRRNVKGKDQMISSSVLINAMRNLICGISHVHKFRTALNDFYMDELKKSISNPDPRIVVSIIQSII